jgi:hypothetical protein
VCIAERGARSARALPELQCFIIPKANSGYQLTELLLQNIFCLAQPRAMVIDNN